MIYNISKNKQEGFYQTIEEVLLICEDNDTLRIESGIYEENLTVKKELTIIGLGEVKIFSDNSKYENTLFVLEKVKLINITIESMYGNALHLYTSMDSSIIDCNIISNKGRAITITGCSYFVFDRCKIKSPDTNIIYDCFFDNGGEIKNSNIEAEFGFCVRVIKQGVLKLENCILESKHHLCCLTDEAQIKTKDSTFKVFDKKDIVIFQNMALPANFIYL
jgi:hypothetical protein